jgi:pimeloyl-ACP methyl ester carboxylesterase
MDIILIPGLWLDGSSWERVVPPLEQAGHRVHPLTLPGLESKDADRSGVSAQDHVDAVVREIDAADGPVLLVGHSAGAGIASAAVDARPDRVARAVYVGGFPAPDGEPLMAGFAVEDGDLPMPDLSEFDDADLNDLDDAAKARFRERAIPSPARLTTDPLHLTDERRYEVPVTVVCPEFTSDMLRGWIAEGMAPVREFTKIRDLEYVDLPTGHWPQFTRPEELARIILERAS